MTDSNRGMNINGRAIKRQSISSPFRSHFSSRIVSNDEESSVTGSLAIPSSQIRRQTMSWTFRELALFDNEKFGRTRDDRFGSMPGDFRILNGVESTDDSEAGMSMDGEDGEEALLDNIATWVPEEVFPSTYDLNNEARPLLPVSDDLYERAPKKTQWIGIFNDGVRSLPAVCCKFN